MFSIHVISAYREEGVNFAAHRARTALRENNVPGFTFEPDPAKAGAILFFEHHPDGDPFYLAVLRHPLVRRFPGKCLLCHDHDFVAPFLPGLYCSLLRRDFRPGRVEPWIYLNQQDPNPSIHYEPPTGAEPYLFSFMGAVNTHRVRRELQRLAGPRSLVADTSGTQSWRIAGSERSAYQEAFARSLVDSQFVLCPRGMGPNSYRIGEAMQAGRAPVIVSDDFLPPAPLPWADFALFVSEAEVSRIPQLLAEAAPLAPAMGRTARAVWEQWCAWPAGFARLTVEVQRLARNQRPAFARRPLLQAARLVSTSPRLARLLVRSLRHRRLRRQLSAR